MRRSVTLGLALVCAMGAPGRADDAEDQPAPDTAALVQRLGARLHRDRAAARAALVRAGLAAVPALEAALGNPDRRVRLGAAQVLGRLKAPAAVGALTEVLQAEAAAARAGNWPDPSLAHAACLALVRCGRPGWARVEEIALGDMKDMGPIRGMAHAALIQICEEPLLEVFARSDGNGSYPGRFSHLRRYGRYGVRKLLQFARQADPSVRGRSRANARLAIQALGDGDHEMIPDELRKLAKTLEPEATDPYVEMDLNEVAHSLFRLGDPSLLDQRIAFYQSELRVYRWRSSKQARAQLNLAHRYLHRNETALSVKWFTQTAQAYPDEYGTAWYNAACAYARAGDTGRALAALRTAITPAHGTARKTYDDLDWMRKDGDLRAIQQSAGFSYLCAVLIAFDRIGHQRPRPDSDHLKDALAALREARARGYRVLKQGDRHTVFGGLQGVPEFEQIWKALGGDTSPAPNDDAPEPPFGGR